MTTIAFCGRYLAADRRYQSGSVPHYEACKIFEDPTRNGAFYASTGPSAWMAAWIAWDNRGADPHGQLPVNNLEGYQGGLTRIRDGKCDMLDPRIPYWTTAGDRWAWGSGADFALAAMACGKIAMKAVQIAGQFDTATGGGIDFVDLAEPEKGVQRYGNRSGDIAATANELHEVQTKRHAAGFDYVIEAIGETKRLDEFPVTRTATLLDERVAEGDIDAAVGFAKELAYINGSSAKTLGMTALILLQQSFGRVWGEHTPVEATPNGGA